MNDDKRRSDILAEMRLMRQHGHNISQPRDYQRLERALAEITNRK